MVHLLAYFARGRNYPMIRMMKSDDIIKNGSPSSLFSQCAQLFDDQYDDIGMVPPLAYFTSGGGTNQ